MYKPADKQVTFLDFNQPYGLNMNTNNRWIKLANQIPWSRFEEKYAKLFKGTKGRVAKPVRFALGCLIIQTKYNYSDRELVAQLAENPYFQYFIGLPGYKPEAPINPSTLTKFRKRINHDIVMEINETIIEAATETKSEDKEVTCKEGNSTDADISSATQDMSTDATEAKSSGSDELPKKEETPKNRGTLILDATCAPQNIRYPQDTSLLNECRVNLETMLKWYAKQYHLPMPRTYCKIARRDYLSFAKSKKRTSKQIRKAIAKQLHYVKRDIGYIEDFMAKGYAPKADFIPRLLTIYEIYAQQSYMHKNHTHSVDNRIVSVSQPWIRPIVRGKAKTPVEFGAKFDLSLDEHGLGRIEKISYDAYNESSVFINAVERFKKRTGYYPERSLVDKIYRTRDNIAFCKKHGIRLSGPKLGRPANCKDKETKKLECKDNVDRIEVERRFSLCKRCYGLGLIKSKLHDTTLTSIALSIFVSNLFKISTRIFWRFLQIFDFFNFLWNLVNLFATFESLAV